MVELLTITKEDIARLLAEIVELEPTDPQFLELGAIITASHETLRLRLEAVQKERDAQRTRVLLCTFGYEPSPARCFVCSEMPGRCGGRRMEKLWYGRGVELVAEVREALDGLLNLRVVLGGGQDVAGNALSFDGPLRKLVQAIAPELLRRIDAVIAPQSVETHEQRWHKLGYDVKWNELHRKYEVKWVEETRLTHESSDPVGSTLDRSYCSILLPTIAAVDEWIVSRPNGAVHD